MATPTSDNLKMAYTRAVRTGVLNLQQRDFKQLPNGVFTLHEFVPDENGWWELLVPHTLILTHNELTDISAPKDMNWDDSWKELQVLNISYNQIRDIPIEILKLELLRKLILHHNKLRQLPLIANLTQNLTCIELQHNNLIRLDENIGFCLKLQHLNISYNTLKSLPKSLSNCVELQTFEATNNNISGDLNHIDFSKCQKLREFDLSNNQITSIHSSIFKSPSLYRLALRQNKISQIILDEIEQKQQQPIPSKLVELYLGNNKLSAFPFNNINLQSLKLLDLKGNRFSVIDGQIYKCCSGLNRLDISDNNLNDIPAELSLIEPLKSIIVTGNPLRRVNRSVTNNSLQLKQYLKKRLPQQENVGNIVDSINSLNIAHQDDIKIKEFKMNKCGLVTLPVNIPKMQNLHHLELDENQIEDINDLSYCKNLRILSLRKNKIKNIECLFALNKLEIIDLRINRIQHFKVNVTNNGIWPKLHTLRMGYNRLKNASMLLNDIVSEEMNVLDFSNNGIDVFPECILRWKSLTVLDLSNNDLSKIPAELGLLERLNALMLNGNRLRRMQSVINSGNTERMLKWLRNRL